MLDVLSIATLFPDASRPNFGIFVERSLAALARQPGVRLTIVAPIGLPPFPLSLHPRYRALRALPERETWHGLTVLRPRFTLLPGRGAAGHAARIARAVLPHARALKAAGRLDVIDAQFFHPDGPAAHIVAEAIAVPFSVKARGADISYWAQRADTAPAIVAAAHAADGLLSVAASLRADMIAVGMPGPRIRIHHTGLDAQRFAPQDRAAARAAWAVPAGARVLLTVGALIARKGQARVIDALATLPADVVYLLAGSGEEQAALTAQAAARGLSARVRLLGAVPHDALPGLYAAADVMVLPSASEGLANAWVEALGCGVPLVLSDIAPARDLAALFPDAVTIAADGPAPAADTGALPAAIRAALDRPLTDPADRAALADAVTARFDWARNGAELAEHLAGIVVRAGGRASGRAATPRLNAAQ